MERRPETKGEAARLRIADIAQAAGVSVSTVSRILNDKSDVSSRTRAHVLGVIESTGYLPDPHARVLASGRSDTITLIYPVGSDGSDEVMLEFIVSANEVAADERFFFNLSTREATEEQLMSIYRSGRVGGIILMQICLADWRVEYLKERGLPFVMIGRTADCDDLCYVDLDFENAVTSIFDYLVGLGHRRIGYLARTEAVRRAQLGPAVREMSGYRKAMRKHKLERLYLSPESNFDSHFESTQMLLRRQPDLSAIVTTWDEGVTGVVEALRAAGRRIPEDVSVVCSACTDKVATSVVPAITSVSIPSRVMGAAAARMLVKRLRDPGTPPEQLLLNPELKIRASTAPVRRL
ncbi:MAG TPA: LacI family DNA-binding transcriptional regulator [Spirochaetia bacterium]|nr:LacI family DNA-binding transcriptional regulator [Spirochaetia bacterium]